jgi:hypothetical protein
MDKIGILHLNSWAGRTRHPCKIIRETSKRYRIKLLENCPKGKAGTILLVPKYAISYSERG